MANIFEGLRKAALSLLGASSSEEETLRHLYSGQGGFAKNQWYRLYNAAGTCVGFSYVCKCGTEYQLLNALEWYRDYKCGCGGKFELLRFVGLTPDSPIKSQNAAFAKLPIRPRAAGAPPKPRSIDIWEQSGSGDVQWTGSNDRDRLLF